MIGVIEILKANAGVTAIVGAGDNAKIYPLEAAQTQAVPYIVVRLLGNSPQDTKQGVSSLDETTVAVYCCQSSYLLSRTLAEAVRSALDRSTISGGAETVQAIYFQDEDTYKAEIGSGTDKTSGSNKEIYETEHIYNVWIKR